MRISGRLSLEHLVIFFGLVARIAYAEDCSLYHIYLANFVTQVSTDYSGWNHPYVVMGVADNDQPAGMPDAKGLNLNRGAGGSRVFMGAQLIGACLGSTTQVVTNMSISTNPDCSTLGSGWVPEVGHVNLKQGVATPGLWLCLKFGSPSDTNLYGAGFKLHSYTKSADRNFVYTDNINPTGEAIAMEQYYSNCGGKCQNGGLCFLGKCDCPNQFTGTHCEQPIMSLTATYPSACSFNVSTTGGTAPFRYSVNNGPQSSNTVYKVSSTSAYTVTSYDANGYSKSTSVSVPAPTVSALASASSYSNTANLYTTAFGRDNAAFSVSGGGKAPFTYTLTPSRASYSYSSGNEGKFQNIPAGTYSLVSTDADGCQSSPTTVTVVAQTVAPPPVGISASISNANNAPFATVSWVAPSSSGYTEIVGYLVSWGYKSSTGVVVWRVNQTVTSGLTTTVSDTTASTSSARYVRIASINSVGTGAFSSTVYFDGLCGAGYYNTSRSSCTPCAAGYNTLGLIGKSVCRACAAGTFSTSGSPTCTSCSGNTYSKSAAVTCTVCPAGSISVSQQYCQACPPGSYASAGYFTTSCSQCGANTYAADAGSSSCSACPAGLTSQPGATSCADNSGYKK